MNGGRAWRLQDITKNTNWWFATACTLLFTISFPATSRAETDFVVMINGDRLTGELKSLERGKLRFDSSATGTIPIEWDEVAFVHSDQNIQVETEQGERFLGNLETPTDAGTVVVETASGAITLQADHVVIMSPIEEKTFDRIDGDISAGFNFAKASQVKQSRVGLNVAARDETRIYNLGASAVTSDSEDNSSSQRLSLDLSYTRLWPNRWLTGAIARFDRNDELGLDLRTSVGIGGGYNLRQTNSSSLSLIGGLQVSRENLSGNITDEDTLELFTSLKWDWFRYDTPELDFATELQIIPNLTDTGRLRGELDISMRWEIVADLFWELAYYYSYDSAPVLPAVPANDYGINSSLGYSF